MTDGEFSQWMESIQRRTEEALLRFMPSAQNHDTSLEEAMRYAVLGGGKRIRSLLCHAAGVLSGAKPEDVDVPSCAVEIIHCYSLVHDDLPCVDNDDLRRGQPSCHAKYGEAMALLAGDALHSLAFEILAHSHLATTSAEQATLQIITLSQAAGLKGMAGGQAMDLFANGKQLAVSVLEKMHQKKTGALIRASLTMGYACGFADGKTQTHLHRLAQPLGLLFQVVDDILDATTPTDRLGKTAGKDAKQHKATYVTIMGLADAKILAGKVCEEALEALAPLDEKAEPLRHLTRLISKRHA